MGGAFILCHHDYRCFLLKYAAQYIVHVIEPSNFKHDFLSCFDPSGIECEMESREIWSVSFRFRKRTDECPIALTFLRAFHCFLAV